MQNDMNQQPMQQPMNMGGIQKREIVMALVLSIVTCGIYAIIWMIKMADDINYVTGDANATSGVMVFVFSLITCGIYSIIWQFKAGSRLAAAGAQRGITIKDNSVLYLILCLFGLGIVNYCLIQTDLNKFAA